MFENLETLDDIEEEKDVIGQGVIDSGLGLYTIAKAYFTESKGGALALNFEGKDNNGQYLREQFWVKSGKAKGCKNYYKDKNGNKRYLPGFNMANSLCQLVINKEISKCEVKKTKISLWNNNTKSLEETEVDALPELLSKKIGIGAIKCRSNKVKYNQDTGKYDEINEERFTNEIDKFFHPKTGQTITEMKGKSKAVFKDKWVNKWRGKTKDTYKEVDEGTYGSPLDQSPAESLFS